MTEKDFKQIFPLGEKNDAYAQYFVGSGKRMALLPAPPLRIVRESFPSYGSSNSKLLFVTKSRLIVTSIYFC